MREHFLGFDDIYYIDEDSINSIYSQLTDNIESISIEKGKSANVSFLTSAVSFLLKLFGKELNIDTSAAVNFSKAETITRTKTLTEKFHDILKVIDEKEYKDIFTLIDQYMASKTSIIAIGKGDFIALNLHDKEKHAEIRDVKFPMKIDNIDFLLFSGKVERESNYGELFNKLNPEFHLKAEKGIPLSAIVFPSESDITDTVYSKKAYIIMDSKKQKDKFSMYYTADRTFYFFGEVIQFWGNYFIYPFALWGRAVIL